ncbi:MULTISPECIES: hypothetical protein [unclassified Streptomyces]|uniref:hypothetical protein n=1 Tax=unclassified Streptomyces TaxID=2593676 RepID=UPI002DD93BF1|nr:MULTISPECIES: hypothetical protein [unclassified Streptomyces]WSA90951.1 hypothetical protein OIE63_04890 [Streptomyces sp. NBC_01795]WSB75276.1 hypothetical protein OHB04_05430 [Streptomyces sp. NBC_01775]WSS45259.1 hypothetical protein OG220_35155 [Streptomyces sp. NBC_01187]
MRRGTELRPELLPPPVDEERLAELGREIERVAGLVARDGPADAAAEEAVAAFNARTGHAYSAADFASYAGWRSLADFAREAARAHRPHVEGITRSELAEIIRRIQAADPETDHYLRLLDACVPHPNPSDLIFHPPPELRDAPPEALADAALAHRAIAL